MATTKKTTKKTTTRPARTSTPKGEAKAPGALELSVFGMDGKSAGTLALPTGIFDAKWRSDLVHQVTTALAANKRQNRAHTKDRAEVAGGGRKPWKQKGTGQARHGSTRSPIWRGGGITFGPRKDRDYHEKINKKMKVSALYSVLSRKAKDGEIVLVDKFTFAAPKTKEALGALLAVGNASKTALISDKKNNSALIALSGYDANAIKSFRNLEGVSTEEVRNLNPLEIMSYKYLVIEQPNEAFKTLGNKK